MHAIVEDFLGRAELNGFISPITDPARTVPSAVAASHSTDAAGAPSGQGPPFKAAAQQRGSRPVAPFPPAAISDIGSDHSTVDISADDPVLLPDPAPKQARPRASVVVVAGDFAIFFAAEQVLPGSRHGSVRGTYIEAGGFVQDCDQDAADTAARRLLEVSCGLIHVPLSFFRDPRICMLHQDGAAPGSSEHPCAAFLIRLPYSAAPDGLFDISDEALLSIQECPTSAGATNVCELIEIIREADTSRTGGRTVSSSFTDSSYTTYVRLSSLRTPELPSCAARRTALKRSDYLDRPISLSPGTVQLLHDMFTTEARHPGVMTLPLAFICWVPASTSAVGYIRPRTDLNFLAGLTALMHDRPLCGASSSRDQRRLGTYCNVPGLCIRIRPHNGADADSAPSRCFYTSAHLNMLPTSASSPPVVSVVFVGDNIFRLGFLASAHAQPAAANDNPRDIHMTPDGHSYTIVPSTSSASAATMGGAHWRTILATASELILPATPRLIILEPNPPEDNISRCLWNGVPRSMAIFDRDTHGHLIGQSPDTIRPDEAPSAPRWGEQPGSPAGADASFFNDFLASSSPPSTAPDGHGAFARPCLSPVLSPPSYPLDAEQHISSKAAVSTPSVTPVRHTPAGAALEICLRLTAALPPCVLGIAEARMPVSSPPSRPDPPSRSILRSLEFYMLRRLLRKSSRFLWPQIPQPCKP